MADFQLQITGCDEAYKKKTASRATADINAFNVARETLEGSCRQLGSYVNTIAHGDNTIVIASGVPSYETGNRADYSAPAAAARRLRPGGYPLRPHSHRRGCVA